MTHHQLNSPKPKAKNAELHKEYPFERRQERFLKRYTPQDRRSVIRVVSYNVLADCYTSMPVTADKTFPYCPKQFLKYAYRKRLLLKELAGYNADIICLQEVDERAFESDYKPALAKLGYDGYLCLKVQPRREGLALFFGKDRFEIAGLDDHFIGGCLSSDEDLAPLYEKIIKIRGLHDMLLSRSTVLQIAHLVDKTTGERLLIANTHLFYEWTSNYVRLFQAYVCGKVISRTQDAVKVATGSLPKVIFCGDFNSDYRRGVYRLLTKGSIPGNFAEFYEGGRHNLIPDLGDLIKIDLRLFSASGKPEFTVYVAGFATALDFVYAEQGQFEVSAVLPMYDEEECMAHIALPNEYFPSDHMAVVVDLKYVKTTAANGNYKEVEEDFETLSLSLS